MQVRVRVRDVGEIWTLQGEAFDAAPTLNVGVGVTATLHVVREGEAYGFTLDTINIMCVID